MNKLLFLVSSNGGLLKFVYSCIEKGILSDYIISAVVADRNCGAYQFAKKKDLNCCIVKYDKHNREQLLSTMRDIEFDIAITTFYKLLDADIVNSFVGKLINVHPSLLPAFPGGLNASEVALKYGVKFLGTTIHFIDEGIDTGEIISQSVMPVEEDMSVDIVLDNQFRSWCLSLLNVLIRRVNEGAVDKARNYQNSSFNPQLCIDTDCINEEFWSELKNA